MHTGYSWTAGSGTGRMTLSALWITMVGNIFSEVVGIMVFVALGKAEEPRTCLSSSGCRKILIEGIHRSQVCWEMGSSSSRGMKVNLRRQLSKRTRHRSSRRISIGKVKGRHLLFPFC